MHARESCKLTACETQLTLKTLVWLSLSNKIEQTQKFLSIFLVDVPIRARHASYSFLEARIAIYRRVKLASDGLVDGVPVEEGEPGWRLDCGRS